MLLKALSLQNFKGIRDPIRIAFKPITLLFGPNSSGKSTILQALVYTREVIERHNLDPDQTLLGGEWLDLGGFESLIHNHAKTQSIRIGFEIDLQDHELPDYLSESEYYMLESWEHSRTPDEWLSKVKTARAEFTIIWSNFLERPLVDSYRVYINDQLFADIRSSTDSKDIAIRGLNIEHPLLWDTESENYESASSWFEDELLYSALQVEYLSPLKPTEETTLNEEQAEILRDFQREPLFSNLSLEPSAHHASAIGLISQPDALPHRGRSLRLDSSIWRKGGAGGYSSPYRDHPLAAELLITSVLSGLIVGPLDLIGSELDKLLYLGPIREIPPRHHQPPRTPDLARWARGLSAWDALQVEGDHLVEQVNEWLEHPEKINSGYSLAVRAYRQLDMQGPLYRALIDGRYADPDFIDEDLINQFLADAPVRHELRIRAAATGTDLEPADLGVGISQMVPVITAALFARSGVVAMEQPELHIHPAWQVVLGDLFLSQVGQKNIIFLLETHSEHLLLRIMKRIRQTFSQSVPVGHPSASPDDIEIIFVNPDAENGVELRRLAVDEQGNMLDEWPRGFFEESYDELFRD